MNISKIIVGLLASALIGSVFAMEDGDLSRDTNDHKAAKLVAGKHYHEKQEKKENLKKAALVKHHHTNKDDNNGKVRN